MTKNDYIKFASTFKSLKPKHPVLVENWKQEVDAMCGMFQRDNVRFDPIRFKTACNY